MAHFSGSEWLSISIAFTPIPVTLFSQRACQHTRIISIFVGKPRNCSPCFDPPLVNCELNRSNKAPMPSCTPGSSRNWLPFSSSVHPPQQRFQKGDGGRIGTRFPQLNNWIACTRPYVCCSFWIIWQDITVAIWSSGVGNKALGSYTPLVQDPGSIWPNPCNASSSDER